MNEELLADPGVKAFVDSLNELKELDDTLFTDDHIELIMNNLEVALSEEQMNRSANQILQNFEMQGSSRQEVQASMNAVKDFVEQVVYGDTVFTSNKRKVIDMVVDKMFDMFDQISEKYHFYSIELPIMLEDGAQVPTYAHDDDAAADMYAFEDITIQPHTHGTPVATGVHIQLPEGWVAFVLPRSSMGAKTPLRLSNSMGVIDSGYRGEVRAIYDNISDDPYEIHKGDRIAQMLVMPSYRFKANVVDSLTDSDRGLQGFGSTGK